MPLQQRIAISLVLTSTLLVSRASAQRFFGQNPARSDPLQGVYVRDSAVVDERFALAQRLERLKEWDKSADVYQEIVEKYSDRVVLVSGGGGDDPTKNLPRYASVSLKVQELLGKWPDEGLKRYRARYEASAASLLEGAGQDDVAALSRVMQRYFATDAAKAAGFRLIELYIESGEFPAAAWVGERMLAYHPGVTDADRPRLLFRTALAEHLGNDDVAAKRNADELTTRFAAATGTWHGEEAILSAEMAKILSGPGAVARGGSSPDVWPTFGGDASRGRIPAAAARPSARLPGTIELRPAPNAGTRAAAAAQNPDVNTERSLRDQGAYLNIMPAVDRGEVFFQDGQRLYAKGLESGLTLPGWSYAGIEDPATPPLRRGPIAGNAIPGDANSGAQFTVTLTDTSVLAVLRFVRVGPGHDPSGNLQQTINTPLVCHDRVTGAQRWSISPSQFPQTPQQNLRDLEMGGAPLVVGDNVYVAAHGGRSAQTENAYVLCFGLRDGKLKWSCYLASSSGFAANAGMGSSPVSHLAYAGGRIYAVTNLGAVAAVDAYSGTIVWLTLYQRTQMNFNMGGGGAVIMSSGKPWSQNPAIVKDGKVFCLPSDAQFVYIYDAGTGAEIKRIGMSGDFDNASTLLGVAGDRLIVNSLNKVFCINWAKSPDDAIDWTSTLAGSGALEKEVKDTIRGRGFVTADSVFIPTLWDLRRIKLDGGKLEGRYPPKDDWNKKNDEGPGNVLVTSDQVIVAGIYNLNVYSDFGLVQSKLDREVQEKPNDPLPRLKYAETLFAVGDINAAMEKLDQAIALLGGLNGMRPGSLRERVFARSKAFARRSWDPQVGVADIARANALYDRCAAAAYTPQQQVTYRLSRAKFAHKQRDRATEARLNQEILANPSWRIALVSPTSDDSDSDGGDGTIKPAHVIAESNIADVIAVQREAYAPFEKAAHDALAAAQAQNDPPAMLAVAQTYPNAQAAPLAMLAAAQAFEDAKNSREATRVLAEAFRKYHDKNDDATKALILEAQARNYLLVPGGMGTAIGRMLEGIKLAGTPKLSKPLKLPDGDEIVEAGTAFAVVAYRLQLYTKRQVQATLPDFNLPRPTPGKPKFVQPFAPEAPETIIADCDQLLLPPRELRDRMRFDRVVTWTKDKGVSVYAVGGTAPLGTAPVGDNKTAPRGAIWLGNDLVVWTSDAVMLFKGDTLAAGWRVALATLEMPEVIDGDSTVLRNAPPIDAQPGPDDVVMPRALRANPNFIVRGNVRIAIGGAPGIAGVGPQPVPRAGQAAPAEQVLFLRPVGDRAVFVTNYARIAAIDIATGQIAWQTRIADSLSDKDQVLANDDFLAARYGTPEGLRIVALDAYAGQIVYGDFPGNDLPPQNLALSPDGLLVYTLPDRVRVKNLFEPGKELKFKDAPLGDPNNNNRPFEGCVGPDQLVVAEGRILALAERGQTVWVLSSDDGQKVALKISTQAKPDTFNVAIRVIGSHLYLFTDRKPISIELDDREPPTDPYTDLPPDRTVTDEFVGKQHLVLVTTLRPTDAQPGVKKDTSVMLLALARYPSRPDRNDESGRLDHAPPVSYPTEITQWQPVEGGFYFCGADRRAHFLKGAGTATPPNRPNPQ